MATFFGEVVPVFSRAVGDCDEDRDDDDDDEDEAILRELEEKREVRLEWYPTDTQPTPSESNVIQCSDFIIAVDRNAASFLSVYVLSSPSWKAIGQAAVWNERSRDVGGHTCDEQTCVFYQQNADPSVVICLITCYLAEDQQFQWTEKVFGCLSQRGLSVTVLADCPMADYKSLDYQGSSSVPFLRCLQTGASETPPGFPLLEQPNIVTGVPAAVLSHCQLHHIPAVVYQCFSDVISPDTTTMETYKPAFTHSLAKLIKLDPLPSADIIRKFVKTSEIQSNIYI